MSPFPEVLYHFSDESDIEVFHPRPPVRHPESEPFVYAIDAWHSPLYFFPRECPRIGIWPIESTTVGDHQAFMSSTSCRMKLFVDATWAKIWQDAHVYRYSFAVNEFQDCHDHGVWVSKTSHVPLQIETLRNLPGVCAAAGVEVEIVASLVDVASELYDMELEAFRTTLHVSMVRMGNLPGWMLGHGAPVMLPALNGEKDETKS